MPVSPLIAPRPDRAAGFRPRPARHGRGCHINTRISHWDPPAPPVTGDAGRTGRPWQRSPGTPGRGAARRCGSPAKPRPIVLPRRRAAHPPAGLPAGIRRDFAESPRPGRSAGDPDRPDRAPGARGERQPWRPGTPGPYGRAREKGGTVDPALLPRAS